MMTPYRRPRSRSTCCLSPPSSSEGRLRRRVRLLAFFSSRWARNAFRRRIRPEPVTLKRLAAPRWVFILGIGISAGGGGRKRLRRRRGLDGFGGRRAGGGGHPGAPPPRVSSPTYCSL